MSKRALLRAASAALAVQVGFSVQAALRVANVEVRSTGVVHVDLADAEPAATARPVYLAWGAGDRGSDYADWERVRRVGTLAAGATTFAFDVPNGVRDARAMRVYLFSGETTGDVWLDAIKADSDQYINTGVKPNPRTACFADFKLNDKGVQQRVFGCDATVCLEAYINGSAQWAYTFKDGSGDWRTTSVGVTTTDRVQMLVDGARNAYHLDLSDVNKKTLDALSGTRTKEATAPLGVFTHLCLSNGNVTRYMDKNHPHNGYTYADLYSFWMTKDGELVVNLKPCVKDGVPCAYDSISKTYKKSGTSNAFKAVDPIGLPVESVAVPMRINGTVKGYGESDILTVSDGTVTYRGAEGVKGSYDGDVKLTSLGQRANVFDITGDLTLTKTPFVDCQNGHYPAIVKTGPGTLNIPGEKGVTNVWNLGGFQEARAFPALSFDGNGTATNGYTYMTIADGTLALGEGGGRFEITDKVGADLMIGTMTVDPKDDAGQQEKSGILEIRGGETVFNNWVTVGGKNGFATTTPDFVPTSGVRVLAGRVDFKGSFTMGRNKNGTPQKDASGNFILQRTCPFVEVLGGKCQFWNTSRVGLADDPGADSRILVDTGTFYVCNKDNTTGGEIVIGQCNDGVADAARHCDITVQNGGTFDVTGVHLLNYKNITCDITVKDGGIFRNNNTWKSSTKDGCALKVFFDGGIAELRYGGNTGWMNATVDSFEVGTRGITFRAGSGCNKSVLNYVNKAMVARDTHPDEEPQGVTVTFKGSRVDSGWAFAAANSYAGPTFVGEGGRLELVGAGALPTGSALTLEAGCNFAPTNKAHTVPSLTYGRACNYNYVTKLAFVKGLPLTANAFTAIGQTRTDVSLYSAPHVALAETGTFALLKTPKASASELRQVAALMTCVNGAEGYRYAFGVGEDGDQAVLSVTVSEGVQETVAYQAEPGATETVRTLSGDKWVTVNAAGRGQSGTVAFGDVTDFSGTLRLMGGTAVLGSLVFAAENPKALYLGTGTLRYTGPDTTIAGLYLNWGETKFASAFESDSNVTLLSMSVANGMFYKRGTGDLVFAGNGTFALGNGGVGYDQAKPQGFNADGDGPDNALCGLMVADGRLVIGSVGDPDDAPTVYGQWGAVGVGVRTADRGSGLMETAGELVFNNGLLDCRAQPLYVGYYHGYKETTPAAGLHPRYVQNGGRAVFGDLRLGQAWDGTQTTSPEFVMNDGLFETLDANDVPTGIYLGYQLANEIGENVATYVQNGGTVKCGEFKVSHANNTMKVKVELNGGDLYCLRFARSGNATSTDKGYGEITFNGTVVHLGYRRGTNVGCDFADSSDLNKCFNHAYVGAGGAIFDFDTSDLTADNRLSMQFSQKLERDPNLADGEVDGGVTFRNGATIFIRSGSNGATIEGPIKFLNGTVAGIDATGLVTSCPLFIGPGSGIRMSGQMAAIGAVTLGDEGATDLVNLDFCRPADTTTETGLVATKGISIKSSVTVSHHLAGGASNVTGSWIGTMDILLYPASDDANVSLDRFVTNPDLSDVTMTFSKADVTSGKYAGYKKIVVTVKENIPVLGPATATGQTHELTESVLSSLRLTADSAAHGFTLTGGTVDLSHTDFLTAPSLVAEAGAHTVKANLTTSDADGRGGTSYAVGGRTGNILVGAKTGAKMTLEGTVSSAAKRDVLVNPEGSGGGTTVLKGKVVGEGTGVRVNSGTLEIPDMANLGGKTLTIGPATVHLTGPDAMTESSIVTAPGNLKKTSVLRLDNKLVVNGTITASGDGNLIKTGSGELVVNGLVNNQLGGANSSDGWNLDTAWPANGDSLVQGNSPFCLDEGTVTVGRPGQYTKLGPGSDIFLGSQTRGWEYTTDKVTFNMMGGVLDALVLAVGHGMRRGPISTEMPHRVNGITRLTLGGVTERTRLVDFGYNTKYGIQNITVADGKLWCFFYRTNGTDPNCAVLDGDMNVLQVLELGIGKGADALPASRATSTELPQFLVCLSQGDPSTALTFQFKEVVNGQARDIAGKTPIVTTPSEFAGVEGHVQGLACSDDHIYLAFATALVKMDWTGHVVKKVGARRHLGDITYFNGTIYGCLSETADPNVGLSGTPYLVTYDTGLNLLDKKSATLSDGIAVLDGKVIAGRGVPSSSELAYVEFNQYGGIVTNRLNTYVGYDLTKHDSHIRATMNLFGGEYCICNYMRLGQTYNKTGDLEPLSTLNVFAGAKLRFYGTGDDQNGNIYIPYAESVDQLKNSLNRASDAVFNLKGGTVENAYLISVGNNGARGEVHLDGGLLDCENVIHRTDAEAKKTYYYHVFDVADGTAHLYFNGGTFRPRAKMDYAKDTQKGPQYNATLTNFTEAVVQAGGAIFDLSNLSAARYTVAQTLTGSEGDGGLVKSGAKPLALAAQGTYFGDTVVAEGTLVIAATAPAGTILPNSAVRVLKGATLEFETGTPAVISKLAVDCTADANGTIANLRAASGGELHVENAPANWREGELPIAVTGSNRNLGSWTAYVNGVRVEGVRPYVVNGKLMLAPPNGLTIVVR